MDYLSEHQQKKQWFVFRLKIYIVLSIIAIISIAGVYLAAVSPLLKLKKIEVRGLERLTNEELLASLKPIILKSAFNRFLGFNHYLAWSKNQISSTINPLLASLSIEKDLFKKEIIISVKERQRYGIWCRHSTQINADQNADKHGYQCESASGPCLSAPAPLDAKLSNGVNPQLSAPMCWWFDEEGIIFEPAPVTEGHLILKIVDLSDNEVAPGTKILSDQTFGYLQKIISALKKIDIAFKNLIIDQAMQELKIETYDGPKLLFSVKFNPEFSLAGLKALKDKMDLKKIDYIDFRMENRLYYKNR